MRFSSRLAINPKPVQKSEIILASQSPQRKQILKNLGIAFRTIPAHIDEHHDGLKKPFAIAKSIAQRKAETIAEKYPEALVIGCDTIVVLENGKIALKPFDSKDAGDTLKAYSDSYCDVYSGLALINCKLNKKFVQAEKTRIHFRRITPSEITAYLKTGGWKGRSGALTIEEKADWVKKIEGDYWNIVGLPVNLLKKMLSVL